MKVYYVMIGEDQHGPFSLEEVRRLHAAGAVHRETLYWREGWQKWERLEHLLRVLETPTPRPWRVSDLGVICLVGGALVAGTYAATEYPQIFSAEYRGVPVFILVIAGLCVNSVPSLIAWHRKHRNFVALLALNIFLGWTLVGWVAALVWALYREPEPA